MNQKISDINFGDRGQERNEKEPKIIGRITLLRHGQTAYTDVYPDLTAEGEETVKKSAEQILGNIHPHEDVVVLSSDKARARGTADIIRSTIKHEGDARIIPGITSMEMRDKEKGMGMINEFLAQGGVHAIDQAYTHDPRFDDGTIWEPKDEIQKRFLKNLAHAIRAFKVVAEHPELPLPHLIAVTHYEVLTPFLQKVFDIDFSTEPTLKNAEPVEITVKDPSEAGENNEEVFLEVTFRNRVKTIGYNRKSRQLVIL